MKKVSFVICAGLFLSGCATQFGTFTDKTTANAYLMKHQPFHVKARAVTATNEDVPYWKCNGTAETNDPRCAKNTSIGTPDATARQVVVEKPKNGFWARVRSHFHFKKKDQ